MLSEHQNPKRRLLNRMTDPNPPPLGGVGSDRHFGWIEKKLNRRFWRCLLATSLSLPDWAGRLFGMIIWQHTPSHSDTGWLLGNDPQLSMDHGGQWFLHLPLQIHRSQWRRGRYPETFLVATGSLTLPVFLPHHKFSRTPQNNLQVIFEFDWFTL